MPGKDIIVDKATDAGVLTLGVPSKFACPECHGVLLEMDDGVPTRFRCHTGHAYTLESLLSEMAEAIEDSLWNAIRALGESVMLIRERGGDEPGLRRRAEETQRRADLVRMAVMNEEPKAMAAGR